MNDDFKPPIKSRKTEELLKIAGAPKKMDPRALKLALDELYNRKIDPKLIEQAKYIEERQVKFEVLKKFNESYKVSDFIFNLKGTLFELIFTWELKKDGYTLKAEQQKTFRIILIIVILLVYFLSEII
ncbi:MAG: hypothetical protein ABI549_12455 [Flavobacterium sp.]|uniref:hypothetical protein n=1 Tax=Flavobacterium sp. TaxID=239 RepID=UPI003266E0A7